MTATARWPDGVERSHYSPSLVLAEHLAAGEDYPVEDFLARSRVALRIASDRVRARYGFPCSLAAASLAQIESLAAASPPGSTVRVLALDPPAAPPA